MKNSAGRAKKPTQKEILPAESAAAVQKKEAPLKKRVAKLYGRGLTRQKIAQGLYEELTPKNSRASRENRIQWALRRLRRWERDESFRNLVWEESVAELDMDAPLILKGVSRKARQGKVDAAKLALAVTGRHQPIAEQGGLANVQIVFASNLPRPALTGPPPQALSREVGAIVRQAGPILGGDEVVDADVEDNAEWEDGED